jgi:hypothetical protein
MTTMTEKWKTKLNTLGEEEPDEAKLRRLVEGERRPFFDQPEGPSTPSRIAAGVVAFGIFLAAVSLIWVRFGPSESPTTATTSTPSESVAPAPTDQVIGYHGVLVTVPAAWRINDQTCGTPQHDTVLRDVGAVASCLVPRPDGVSSLELFGFLTGSGSLLSELQVTDSFTNASGVRLERGTVPNYSGIAISVPAADVLMLIEGTSSEQTKEIIDSIQLADIDPYGCAMHETQLEPTSSYEPSAAMYDALIPGSPSAIAICHYVDNWLASSATLTGDRLSSFVRLVNGLPQGFVHAPTDSYLPSSCSKSDERGNGYVLWVQGIVDTPIPLWAHVQVCGNLGITNGALARQLTPDFARVLNGPLQIGYVMPGRLVPNGS